jgi:hypothetical protein
MGVVFQLKRVSTRIEGLDEAFEAALPKGSLVNVTRCVDFGKATSGTDSPRRGVDSNVQSMRVSFYGGLITSASEMPRQLPRVSAEFLGELECQIPDITWPKASTCYANFTIMGNFRAMCKKILLKSCAMLVSICDEVG